MERRAAAGGVAGFIRAGYRITRLRGGVPRRARAAGLAPAVRPTKLMTIFNADAGGSYHYGPMYSCSHAPRRGARRG